MLSRCHGMQSHINMQTYHGCNQTCVCMASNISMVTGAGSLDPNPFRMCKSCSVCQDAEFGLNFTAFGWSVLRTKCRSIWYPLGLAHSTCSSNEYLGTCRCEKVKESDLYFFGRQRVACAYCMDRSQLEFQGHYLFFLVPSKFPL